MLPKTRQNPLPSNQAELEAVIATRVAAALAQHEANRTESSGGGSYRQRSDGGTFIKVVVTWGLTQMNSF